MPRLNRCGKNSRSGLSYHKQGDAALGSESSSDPQRNQDLSQSVVNPSHDVRISSRQLQPLVCSVYHCWLMRDISFHCLSNVSSGGTTTASAVRFESDNKESKKSIFLESVLFLYDYSRNEQACQVNTPSVSVLRHRLSPQLLRYLVKSHQHPD